MFDTVALLRPNHIVRLIALVGLHSVLLCCGERRAKGRDSEQSTPTSTLQEDSKKVSLLFVGDVMMHMPQIRASYVATSASYDFTPVFRLVSPLVKQADIAVANLECTLGGRPYSGYPCFSAPDEVATGLRNTGFDVISTANNHIADRKSRGVLRTLDVLDSLRLLHTGSFRSAEEQKAKSPLFIKRNGLSIALIACTYGLNGHIIHPPVQVNMIDTVRIGQDIDRAIQAQADFIIVSVHWGVEYQTTPSQAQTELAAWFVRRGVDVVMGSHPHVVQPVYVRTRAQKAGCMTQDTTALIAYSMGNFVSNQQDFPTGMGMAIAFSLQRNATEGKRITDVQTIPTYVSRYAKDRTVRYLIVPMRQQDIERADLSPSELLLLERYRNKMLQYTQIRSWHKQNRPLSHVSQSQHKSPFSHPKHMTI